MTITFIAKEYQPKVISHRYGALFESKKTLILLDSSKWHATDEFLVRIKKQRNFKPITPGKHINKGSKRVLSKYWNGGVNERKI